VECDPSPPLPAHPGKTILVVAVSVFQPQVLAVLLPFAPRPASFVAFCVFGAVSIPLSRLPPKELVRQWYSLLQVGTHIYTLPCHVAFASSLLHDCVRVCVVTIAW
jgi:hypothetical protein